jgi:hypothetical protein
MNNTVINPTSQVGQHPASFNVKRHPALIESYLNQGWSLIPIPSGTKGPTTKGWNKKECALKSVNDLPHDWGVGLGHAYSGTMALDVDNWDRAVIELAKHNIDLNALYNAPDAVTIESGKPGHGKLLYLMPFGLALASKKLLDVDNQGGKYNYLDFRCGTSNGLTAQDILPSAGVHPETLQPYRWGGNGHWSRPPTIPMALLNFWQGLVAQDSVKNISDGGIDASWDDIRYALDFISPDISRDEWVSVGMALHWAGIQTDQQEEAFYLWDEWSAQSKEKYQGVKDLVNSWRSFNTDGGTTIGTLFHIARDHGWKKPLPSIEELFSSVKTSVVVEGQEAQPYTGLVDVLAGLKPPAPDIDLSLWPSVLATRATEISDSVGCDPLVPLFAGLAVISGVIDSRTRLELLPGYRVPPVLWIMTIGDPADKKSPGSRPMMSVLKDIEMSDRDRYKKDFLKWQGEESAYAAAHKNFLDFYSKAEHQLENNAIPDVPELKPQPVPVKITVQDITSQKLVRSAADRPRGLLCWLDEMNSWAKKITDPRSGEDRSAWVMSFESEPYEMDRVGAGSIWCENLAVSIYGNIQPKVFKSAMKSMAEDGLIQRFIPAPLRHDKTRLGQPLPDSFSTKPLWDQTVKTSFALPDRLYTLSPEAMREFRDFQGWYEQTKTEERLIQSHDTFMTAFGKLEGQCGRLALILHVMETPFSQEVSGDLMRRVIGIIRGYVIPAIRHAFGEVGGLVDDSLDSWVASHILHNSSLSESLSLRDLKHSARRRLADMSSYQKDSMLIEAMTTLEQYNWVALVDVDPKRNQYNWAINPQLAETFKKQRETVIRIKQARLDENWMKTNKRSERKFVKDYDPSTMDKEDK